MFVNYLKIAWRNIRLNKGFSFINMLGLTVGLTVCVLIGLYVSHELSYDRFHTDADQIYRVIQGYSDGQAIATTPPGLAQVLENNLPEVIHTTVIRRVGRRLFNLENEQVYIDHVFRVDTTFFDLFSFTLVQGNPNTVLKQPGQMIITQSLARQLFGEQNPVGKVLTYENQTEYVISGIAADPPAQSHFTFNVLLSYSDSAREARYGETVNWPFFGGYLYLKSTPESDFASLQDKITQFEETINRPEGFRKHQPLIVQKLTDIHLHSHAMDEISPQSDIRYVQFFSAVALLILGIASINYMNLATARSIRRSSEVAVRKVVGARKTQLIKQFLSESMVTAFIALPVVLLFVHTALPNLNRMLGTEIPAELSTQPFVLAGIVGLFLLVGVISGSYPALFLSRFSPGQILTRGKSGSGSSKSVIRQGLVIFQYIISTGLILGTIVIQSQINYLNNTSLGFNEEYVVTFSGRHLDTDFETVRQELVSKSSIQNASTGVPPGMGWRNMTTQVTGQNQERIAVEVLEVGYDYTEVMNINLTQGRAFSRVMPGDTSRAVILNETAVREMGLGEEPLGKIVEIPRYGDVRVIGVIEDFHNSSLHKEIRPVALQLNPAFANQILVRIQPGNISGAIKDLREVWNEFVPARPFEFTFLDERIAQQYREEKALGRMAVLFTSLAIILALLGLFGLSAYSAQQRTQEIGIRKVFGAGLIDIISLLSLDFLKLVVIAMVIAIPLVYYGIQQWLQKFAYHVDVGPGMYLMTIGVAFLLTVISVSWQALKAGAQNPVDTLRYE
ncbi:MAG: FtsX-like permease family protein [Candidatus Marinimicrobia bacterium]|nr:FtsX-like permease family protein [Candidatus Neomarinimicrobiota bacterium]